MWFLVENGNYGIASSQKRSILVQGMQVNMSGEKYLVISLFGMCFFVWFLLEFSVYNRRGSFTTRVFVLFYAMMIFTRDFVCFTREARPRMGMTAHRRISRRVPSWLNFVCKYPSKHFYDFFFSNCLVIMPISMEQSPLYTQSSYPKSLSSPHT